MAKLKYFLVNTEDCALNCCKFEKRNVKKDALDSLDQYQDKKVGKIHTILNQCLNKVKVAENRKMARIPQKSEGCPVKN